MHADRNLVGLCLLTFWVALGLGFAVLITHITRSESRLLFAEFDLQRGTGSLSVVLSD